MTLRLQLSWRAGRGRVQDAFEGGKGAEPAREGVKPLIAAIRA